MQVIHITGAKEFLVMDNRYRGLDINIRLFGFLKQMQIAYSASDLAICRAGATTIQELVFFSLAAILLPYPFAYRHQLANAQVLKNLGGGIIINDDAAAAASLKNTLEDLLSDPDKIKLMRQRLCEVGKRDAADLLRKAVLLRN